MNEHMSVKGNGAVIELSVLPDALPDLKVVNGMPCGIGTAWHTRFSEPSLDDHDRQSVGFGCCSREAGRVSQGQWVHVVGNGSSFSARSKEYIVQAAVAQDGLALEYASARWAVPVHRMLGDTSPALVFPRQCGAHCGVLRCRLKRIS